MSEEKENKPGESSILKRLKIQKRGDASDVKPIKREFKKREEMPVSEEEVDPINVIHEEEFEMVATCMQNMEPELEQELIDLGAKDIRIQRRAVMFKGDLELLYAANIWLRTALKVLKPIYHYTAKNDDELYKRAMKLPWESIFSEEKTFSIDSAVNSEHFTHSQFASLRIKDAIVDRFRAQQLKRPNVERYDPDVRIHLHINDRNITISLDSSGTPLFKRGYRIQQHLAPINECLAAGMILKSGWRGEVDLLDPMTGTGTIAIEAALIACNIPPNLNRVNFAFEGWKSYNVSLLSKVLGEAKEKYKPLKVNIYAHELNSNNIRSARMNINSSNMRKSILLEQADFFKSKPPSDKGCIIMNPPYGERLELQEGLPDFFEKIGSTLKHEYSGWEAWIIASDEESFKNIGLKASKKIPLMNGKLDCQFRKYELFDGKRIEKLKAERSEG
ncbi:MAG: class I SAM-dependent RNA methyltransferase [Flavobacteriales bacterium]|nr:class I SAM-dependent RNA methyltransferase [Flavobacteriales bacterium]